MLGQSMAGLFIISTDSDSTQSPILSSHWQVREKKEQIGFTWLDIILSFVY